MKRTIILAVLIAASFSASADSIVRCKSVDGKKTFFGERCPQGHVYTSSTYTRSVQQIDHDNRIAYEQYKQEEARVAEYNRQVAIHNQQADARREAAQAAYRGAIQQQQQQQAAMQPVTIPAQANQPQAPNNDPVFASGGRVMRPTAGGYTDNKGTTYQKNGESFSRGSNGKNCFHYGQFADCK